MTTVFYLNGETRVDFENGAFFIASKEVLDDVLEQFGIDLIQYVSANQEKHKNITGQISVKISRERREKKYLSSPTIRLVKAPIDVINEKII